MIKHYKLLLVLLTLHTLCTASQEPEERPTSSSNDMEQSNKRRKTNENENESSDQDTGEPLQRTYSVHGYYYHIATQQHGLINTQSSHNSFPHAADNTNISTPSIQAVTYQEDNLTAANDSQDSTQSTLLDNLSSRKTTQETYTQTSQWFSDEEE